MVLRRPLSVNVINQLNTPPETTTLQKVMIIFGMGVFITLVSLTASLPLDYLSHQTESLPSSGDDSSSTLNLGDIAWVVIATIFGILLSPAVSYLYSNLYGRTTSFAVEVSLLVGAMITVLWIVITFSLTYSKDANNDQILGFPKYYYMFAHVGAEPDGEYVWNIPFSIFAVFELSFPILAASIVVSALIDRVNVYGLLTFMFIWHICVYTPIAHITWNHDGFFYTNTIEDFSGGIVVHMTAGITAVTGHLFLDHVVHAPKAESRKPTNPEGILFSALIVWFLWFGINAGKAYGANYVACNSILNTIGGVSVSLLANYALDALEGFKFSNISVVNSILIGLIATTPSSGYVTVGGSMVVTIITMLTVRVIGKYILKETLEDTPYSIGVLHGVGGSTAFLFTALISYEMVNPQGHNGLTWGHDTPIRHHTAVVLAMWICGFLSIFLALFISNLFVPLSKAKQSVESPKGEFAPAPLGPFSGFKEDEKSKSIDVPEETQA